MVAIFTGAGLGLTRGSSWLLGAAGQLGAGGLGQAGLNVNLNAANGNLVVSRTDEVLTGKGPDDAFSLTYNSQDTGTDDNGDNWRPSGMRIVTGLTGTVNTSGSTVKRIDWDGSAVTYTYQTSGDYSGKYLATDGSGAFDTLSYASSVWTWTDGDSRTVELYDASNGGRITSSTDKNGYSLTYSYSGPANTQVYTSNGELTYQVYNGGGYGILMRTQSVYHPDTAGVVSPDGQNRVWYDYDGNGRLSRVTVDLTPADSDVTDGAKYTIDYTYDGSSNRLASITQSDGSVLSFTYTAYSGVYKVTSFTQTESSGVTRTTGLDYQSSYTKVTDPAGQDTYLYFDSSSQLTKITSPVSQDYQFGYDGSGNVTSITQPSGAARTLVYDGHGNVLIERDAAGNTLEHTYSATDRVLTSTRYLVADPDAINAGSSPSGGQTTRYVYDSNDNLRFVISAEGRVTEHRYTSGVPTATVEYLVDLYTTSGTPSDSTMTSWVSGRSDKSLISLTERTFDFRGNLQRERSYSTNTSLGAGGAAYDQVDYIYDLHGRLLSRTRDGGATFETYAYDGLDRLTSFTDFEGAVTTTAYTDSSQTVAVTMASGLVKTSTFNKAGMLLSTASSGTGLSTATGYVGYDTVGRVGVVVDPDGNYNFALYDAAGRKTADIDPTGAMTEYKYNADNHIIAQVRYATLVSGSTLSTLHSGTASTGVAVGTVRPSGTANDVWNWNVYDVAGRVVETIDGLGGVTTFEYDGASQLVKTTVWANALSSGTVTGFKSTPPTTVTTPSANSGADRVTRLFYDADGKVIGTLDPYGALTETVYDAAGRVIETIAYAYAANSTYWATGSFATLKGSISTDWSDVHNWTIYDHRGLVTATINGEGEVTHFTYDSEGQLTQKIEGDTGSIVTFVGTRPTVENLAAPSGSPLRTTNYSYDDNGRLLQVTGDAVYTTGNSLIQSGSTTVPTVTNVYDSVGNLIQTTDANGGSTWFYYDKLARKTAELNALGTLSTWTYDAAGNVTSAKVYGSAFSLPGSPGSSAPSVGSTPYRETTFTYDGKNRLVSSSVANVLTCEFASGSYGTTTGTISTTTYYNALGQIERTVDGRGNSSYFFYDVRGRQIASVDQEKFLTYTTYDALGDVTKVERFATAVSSVSTSSDPASLRSSVAGASGDRVTDYTYDRRGRVLTESVENVVASSVNATTGALAIGSAGAVTNSFTYNLLGQLTQRQEATGDQTAYMYDRTGRTTRVTSAAFTDYASNSVQTMVLTTYNGLGLVSGTTVRKASATSTDDQVTTYSYGAGGRLISVLVDKGGFTGSNTDFATYFAYDAAGNITKTSYYRTKSDGSTQVLEAQAKRYDALGRVTYEGQATWNGSSWTVNNYSETGYSVFGEVASTSSNGVTQTQNYYDDAGRLWKTNVGGVASLYLYDRNGKVSATINTAGSVSLTGYSLSSAINALTNTGANAIGGAAVSNLTITINVRDKRGLETETRLPYRELTQSGGTFSTANLSESRAYNAFRDVVQSTDSLGGVTDYTYNAMGKVTKVQTPSVAWTAENGALTSSARPTQEFFYDASGRLVGSEDANAHVAAAAYYTTRVLQAGSGYGGSEAKAVKEFHADGGVEVMGFDVYGFKRTETNELGKSTTYDYDKQGRVIAVTHPTRPSGSAGNTTGSAVTLVDHYVYDELGERVAHWNSQLTSSVKERTDYDIMGRVTASIDYSGYTTSYSYSWSGSAASSLGTFGAWIKTTTNTASLTATDTVDNFGRTVDHVDFGGHDYDYTYNSAGWLTLTENKIGSTVYDHIEASYYNSSLTATIIDNATNYTVEVGTHYKTTFNYDAAGRVIREIEVQHYSSSPTTVMDAQTVYDAAGRIVSYSDSGLNGANAASTTYEYDLNNNVRRISASWKNQVTGAGDSSDHWNKYDTMNRVVTTGGDFTGARGSGTISRGQSGTDITYDLAGQRKTAVAAFTDWVDVSGEYIPGYHVNGDYGWVVTAEGFHVAWGDAVDPMLSEGGSYIIDVGGGRFGFWNPGDPDFYVPPVEEWQWIPEHDVAASTQPTGAHEYRNVGQREEYIYTADGYLAQVLTVNGGWNPTATSTGGAGTYTSLGSGNQALYDERDAMGRLIGRWNGASFYTTYTYDENGDLLTQSGGANASTTSYSYLSGSDYIGQVTSTSTIDSLSTTSTTATSFVWWEGAQKSSVTNGGSSTQTYVYDTGGRLVREDVADAIAARSLIYIERASGESTAWYDFDTSSISNSNTLATLLASPAAGPHALTYYSGKRRIGEAGNDGQTGSLRLAASFTEEDAIHTGRFQNATAYADFDQGYLPVNTSNPGTGGDRYTVQRDGATLASVAQSLWGDSSLWWVLAEANGLTASSRLSAGQTLMLPAKVTNLHQNASSFRPTVSINAYTSFLQAQPDYSDLNLEAPFATTGSGTPAFGMSDISGWEGAAAINISWYGGSANIGWDTSFMPSLTTEAYLMVKQHNVENGFAIPTLNSRNKDSIWSEHEYLQSKVPEFLAKAPEAEKENLRNFVTSRGFSDSSQSLISEDFGSVPESGHAETVEMAGGAAINAQSDKLNFPGEPKSDSPAIQLFRLRNGKPDFRRDDPMGDSSINANDNDNTGGARYFKGKLWMADNSYVVAYQIDRIGPDTLRYVFDCHGYTIAGGKYWINNNDMATWLKWEGDAQRWGNDPDHMTPVLARIAASEATSGDIAVYRRSGEVVHSAKLIGNGMVAMADGPAMYGTPLGKVTERRIENGAASDNIQYWRVNQGVLASGSKPIK